MSPVSSNSALPAFCRPSMYGGPVTAWLYSLEDWISLETHLLPIPGECRVVRLLCFITSWQYYTCELFSELVFTSAHTYTHTCAPTWLCTKNTYISWEAALMIKINKIGINCVSSSHLSSFQIKKLHGRRQQSGSIVTPLLISERACVQSFDPIFHLF